MQRVTRARTRRHFFKLASAVAASIPFIASVKNSASAHEWDDRNDHNKENRHHRDDRDDRNDHDREYRHHGDEWDFRNTKKNWNQDPSCLLKGTRIATPLGEIPVQELRIGDEVNTHDGVKKIKWIGHNKFERAEAKTWKGNVTPIRVKQFAIDNRTPYRDLYLSQAHCLFLDGHLIPVEYLINNATIAAYTTSTVDAIDYYHVEFETHEVVYAEGASVESYLGANRDNFSNFIQFERVYGIEHESKKTPYAPIIGYRGGRDELKGLVRSLVSNVVDVRDPIQTAWDRLAERAERLALQLPTCFEMRPLSGGLMSSAPE